MANRFFKLLRHHRTSKAQQSGAVRSLPAGSLSHLFPCTLGKGRAGSSEEDGGPDSLLAMVFLPQLPTKIFHPLLPLPSVLLGRTSRGQRLEYNVTQFTYHCVPAAGFALQLGADTRGGETGASPSHDLTPSAPPAAPGSGRAHAPLLPASSVRAPPPRAAIRRGLNIRGLWPRVTLFA